MHEKTVPLLSLDSLVLRVSLEVIFPFKVIFDGVVNLHWNDAGLHKKQQTAIGSSQMRQFSFGKGKINNRKGAAIGYVIVTEQQCSMHKKIRTFSKPVF